MPSRVPNTKLRTVATPTRASVQGKEPRITELTVAGKNVMEMPRLPCRIWPRYAKYWPIRLWLLLMPNATLKAWSAAGEIWCRTRLKTSSTGLPGISRGMKKLIVIAIQAVIR